MIKAILLDGDGVTLVKQGYFSNKYAREYGVPVEKIMPFFKNEFKTCQLGKADMKEELAKYLSKWGWKESTENFLQYWFTGDTLPNEAVINKIQELRFAGVKCYLVTDQEKYRAGYILEQLEFNKKFDDCFFAFELGYSKTMPEFFNAVLKKLDLKPEEIMFFDDEEEDLRIAARLGIRTKLYRDLEDINIVMNLR